MQSVTIAMLVRSLCINRGVLGYSLLITVFVANQLGHGLQMLIKRYGRWLHGDQNKIEIFKLNTD